MKVKTLRGAPLFLATFLGGLVLALFTGVGTAEAQEPDCPPSKEPGNEACLWAGTKGKQGGVITYDCNFPEVKRNPQTGKAEKECWKGYQCSAPTPQGREPGTCGNSSCCKASREGKLPDGKQDGKKKEGSPKMPQIPSPPKSEPKKEQPQQNQNQNQNPFTNATSATSTSSSLFDTLFGDDSDGEGESTLDQFKNWLERGVDAFMGAGGEEGGTDAEEAANTEFGTALSEGGIANPGSEDDGTGNGGDGTDYTQPGSTFVDSTEEGDATPPSGFWAWLNRLWGAVGF